MADISRAREALKQRILEGDGKTSRDDRREAYANVGPASVRPLLDKVTREAAKVDDADIAAAKAAGLGEDHIFELVVCAAVGQAARQYESALAALAAATDGT